MTAEEFMKQVAAILKPDIPGITLLKEDGQDILSSDPEPFDMDRPVASLKIAKIDGNLEAQFTQMPCGGAEKCELDLSEPTAPNRIAAYFLDIYQDMFVGE